jgi:hypothetical protein
MAKLTSADIKLLIMRDLDVVKGPSPNAEVMYEKEWQDRKHNEGIEFAGYADEVTPLGGGMALIQKGVSKYKNNGKLLYPTLQDWKNTFAPRPLGETWSMFLKNGNYDVNGITRKKKYKDKTSGHWIRVFSCFQSHDHDVIVETDTADENVLSITYNPDRISRY